MTKIISQLTLQSLLKMNETQLQQFILDLNPNDALTVMQTITQYKQMFPEKIENCYGHYQYTNKGKHLTENDLINV